jgi:hypothetical protein
MVEKNEKQRYIMRKSGTNPNTRNPLLIRDWKGLS